MNFDISKLDRHMDFLRKEAQRLRERGDGQWADDKASTFDAICETLRQVRQNQQMTGLGGKRISET